MVSHFGCAIPFLDLRAAALEKALAFTLSLRLYSALFVAFLFSLFSADHFAALAKILFLFFSSDFAATSATLPGSIFLKFLAHSAEHKQHEPLDVLRGDICPFLHGFPVKYLTAPIEEAALRFAKSATDSIPPLSAAWVRGSSGGFSGYAPPSPLPSTMVPLATMFPVSPMFPTTFILPVMVAVVPPPEPVMPA